MMESRALSNDSSNDLEDSLEKNEYRGIFTFISADFVFDLVRYIIQLQVNVDVRNPVVEIVQLLNFLFACSIKVDAASKCTD